MEVGSDAEQLQVLQAACEHADVGLLVLDEQLRPLVVNRSLRELHGHGSRGFVPGEFPGAAELYELDGTPLPSDHSLLRQAVEHTRIGPRLLRVRNEVTGQLTPVLVQGRRLDRPDGSLLGLVLTVLDSGERLRSEARLQHLATTDPLTGLLNRRGLLDRGEDLLQQQRAAGRATSVWLLDVNGLKTVNDQHGHDEGDRLLQAVAEAALTAAPAALVARIGGDEFAVLGPADGLLPERLALALERLSDDRGLSEPASVTVGRADDGHDAVDLLALLTHADHAMYRQRGLRP